MQQNVKYDIIKTRKQKNTIKDRKVLQNFSFCMTNEERTGLDAPSDTGKTTLCKLIDGYLKPDQGRGPS